MNVASFGLALGAFCAATVAQAEFFGPENSRHFIKRVEPRTGVVSYLLKPGLIDETQQHVYFTTKTLTSDGRFLFLYASQNEFAHPELDENLSRDRRRDLLNQRSALIDLATDAVYPDFKTLAKPKAMGIPFIDPDTDQLWYIRKNNGKFRGGAVCRRDLKIDPMKDIVECRIPDEIFTGVTNEYFLSTHLTLTKNRRKAFVTTRLDDRYEQGMINFDTGRFESWGTTPFFADHDQLNPVDESLAMIAWENCWEGPGLAYQRRTGWYPRIWLVHSNGDHEMIPTRIVNRSTHEGWTADGKGFYCCLCATPDGRRGVLYHDLATGDQSLLCPDAASHASLTRDARYVVYDRYDPERDFSGGPFEIRLWDRKTNRGIVVQPMCEPLTLTGRKSVLHPHGHPTFVGDDRYIVWSTLNADGHIDLMLAPVAQFIARTEKGDPNDKALFLCHPRPGSEYSPGPAHPLQLPLPAAVVRPQNLSPEVSAGLDRIFAAGVTDGEITAIDYGKGGLRVAFVLWPTPESFIRCELGLADPSKWDGRFWGLGNGGWAGKVSCRRDGVSAFVNTDLGTSRTDEKGLIEDVEVMRDYSWRATHLMTVEGKRLAEAFYGRKPDRCYFHGASCGGRQGVVEACRFPEDYDGIISEVPCLTERSRAAHGWWRERLKEKYGTWFGNEEIKAVRTAELAYFAERDPQWAHGRFILDPYPTKEKLDGCWAEIVRRMPSIASKEAMWRELFDPVVVNGKPYVPGRLIGVEFNGANSFIVTKYTGKRQLSALTEDELERFAAEPDFWVKPDFSAFEARGGKIIMYGGLEDLSCPEPEMRAFYDEVLARMGGTGEVSKFFAYYAVPGRSHGAKGEPNGPGQVGWPADLPGKIVAWVERGNLPGALDFKWVHEPKVLSITPYPDNKVRFSDKGGRKSAN